MRFTAINEQGHQIVVVVHGSSISTSTNDSVGSVSARGALFTSQGKRVSRLEKGRYEVVDSGEIFVSADPAAP